MFAIRIEEMVCQSLRAWQEGTGGEVMQGGGVEGKKETQTQWNRKFHPRNKISLIWDKKNKP